MIPQTSDLFNALVAHMHAEVDRHQEAHCICPECGAESSPRNVKCSFSTAGFFCFVCGAGYSLARLAEKVGLETGRYPRPEPRPKKPEKLPSWLSYAERLASRYERHPERFELWNGYKPVSRATILEKRLGVGVLPLSRCKHERLIVPIMDGTEIVGLRGRALSCDCGKWLAPGDTRIDLYPLYNQDAIRPGGVIWITENPIDALLLTELTPYVGVAIYSVSYWCQAWLETLKAARPEIVVVALDNDLAGLGGDLRRGEFIRQWLADPKHKMIPQAAGIKIANNLLKAGVPARIYRWGKSEFKADIGTLLMEATIGG